MVRIPTMCSTNIYQVLTEATDNAKYQGTQEKWDMVDLLDELMGLERGTNRETWVHRECLTLSVLRVEQSVYYEPSGRPISAETIS